MTVIGENFPKTRQARKECLARIKKGEPISTTKVPGKGRQPVFSIPLEYLSYNPYNTRFLMQSKTLERRFGQELSDENPEHVHEIETLILNEKKDRNDDTINSLIKDGQLQPGVVTSDGIILAGNRRFRLLNEIDRNQDKYRNPKINLVGLDRFEAVILDDEELSKKEIVRFESFYQFGIEDKVEYDPIQKYIAATRDKRGLGFTEQEIADNFISLTKGDKKVVEKWLSVFDLMNEYLGYIGEEGIYTALKEREEAFLQLYTLLKSYTGSKSGGITWAFDENDINDFKVVFFDFMRFGFPTHNFRIFKEIFSEMEQWKNFNKNVIEVVWNDENRLKTFDEYRKDHPDDNESSISAIRQNDYKEKVEEDLNRLYEVESSRVQNKKAEKKPMEILSSIQLELSKLEENMKTNPNKLTFETDEFITAVKDIQERIGYIKQQID